MPHARPEERPAGVAHQRWPRGRIDDPLVRAIARVPVTVRTKLLIAFVGTSMLLVAVGLLGQLVLGQSNDRVVRLGEIQERATGYGKLRQQVLDLRQLLAENVAGDYFQVWTEVERRKNAEAIDLHARTAVRPSDAATAP